MNASTPKPLRLLFWESTCRCNLACHHCRRLEIAEADAVRDLTTTQAKSVFDSAAELGTPIIVFSGGEPLMRDDWEELAAHVADRKLPAALATNGTLIDSAMARRIRDASFQRVSVSLDGADAATHDAFRGLNGAFEQAMAGVDQLRRLDQEVQINATIAAHNADQLDALHDLAGKIGAAALHLFLLVPVGCGAEIGPSHQLAPDRYEQVLAWICDRQAAERTPELKATCAPHYYRVAARRGLDTGRGRGCLCGLSVIFVSHRGQVFPCGYLPVECGSVRDRPLADIWRDSPVLAELRDFDRLHGKCGRCGYKDVCGGCRARAFAATGNYMAAEPSCTYCPGV